MPYYPQPLTVKKAGTAVGTEPAVNFIEGTNVTITVTDDPTNNEVDVEIAASGGGSTPSDFQPAIVTDKFYYPPCGAFYADVADADYLVAYPIWFSHAETWNRIGIYVDTEGTTEKIRLGIYANATGNVPGALVVDAGEITLSSGGVNEITISQSLSANTLYWLATVSDDSLQAVTFLKIDNADSGGIRLANSLAWVLGSQSAYPYASSDGYIPTRNFSYGALPDPFGTPDEYGFSNVAVFLRKV